MKKAQELNSLALRTRRMWKEGSYSPIDIFAIVNRWKENKITIVKYPMSSRISGMCTKEGQDYIICINSNTSYGRQRFTLAHELYHVLYEDNFKQVICEIGVNNEKTTSEKEADIFASYLLMPYDALYDIANEQNTLNLEKIIEIEQYFQISHQAMLYRLMIDKLIDNSQFERFKSIKISSIAARLGYSNNLYMKTDENRKYQTTGEYIRKIEKLAKNELISNGKREELLLDGFRTDIVYGSCEEEEFIND